MGLVFPKKAKKASSERRKPKAKHGSERRPVGKVGMPTDQKTVPSYKVYDVAIDKIKVVGNRRALDPERSQALDELIRTIGLRTPITVRNVGGEIQLITGLYRLEAAKALKWKTIPSVYIRGGKHVAELWEVSENLHRAELTALEENLLIAKWLKLTGAEESVSAQNGQKKGPGRPKGGIAAAARALPAKGTETAKRKKIMRAVKIAQLTPDAQQAAVDAGFANRPTKLLEIADQKGKAQLKAIQELKAGPRKKKPNASADSASGGELPSDVLAREWNHPKNKNLRRAWKHATPEDRRLFVTTVLKYTPKAA